MDYSDADNHANRDDKPAEKHDEFHRLTLDPIQNVELLWKIDWDKEIVSFQLLNGIKDTYRWFAIGFSRRGEFPRTDFCILHAEPDQKFEVFVSCEMVTNAK